MGLEVRYDSTDDLGALRDYRNPETPQPGGAVRLPCDGARYSSLPVSVPRSVHPRGKPIKSSIHAAFSIPP